MSEIVAKRGGRRFWQFSQMRKFKSEDAKPTLFYNAEYTPKQENFIMCHRWTFSKMSKFEGLYLVMKCDRLCITKCTES